MKMQRLSQPEAASRRRRPSLVLIAALALATGAAHADARTSAPRAEAGTFALQAELRLISQRVVCPPDAPTETCAARASKGLVSGLGSVSATYTKFLTVGPPACPETWGRALAYPIRLVVAAKGEIDVSLAAAAECVGPGAIRTQGQAFTVTGGTGVYAGASGSGTVESTLGEAEGPRGHSGFETWNGTLSVPGLEFDTTPPALTGAVAKTVRAPRGLKRVRVTYTVTARDDVDGAIPVSCNPMSGSRFGVGRTVVTCSASDKSANGMTAKFTVTVKRRR